MRKSINPKPARPATMPKMIGTQSVSMGNAALSWSDMAWRYPFVFGSPNASSIDATISLSATKLEMTVLLRLQESPLMIPSFMSLIVFETKMLLMAV